MGTKQINFKVSENLFEALKDYAERYGYRNIQEFISESVREKLFEKDVFDNSFSEKEVKLIDDLAEKIIEKKAFGTEEELNKILKNEL